MRKFILTLVSVGALACSFIFPSKGVAFADNNSAESTQIVKNCKSAYLCDYYTGECVYSVNEKHRLPIASVCKVMTLNLCLEALDSGKISLDEEIAVSDRAAGMGGSQVFLGSGLNYKVDDLIKSIVVCSANDSCVALAEAIYGSEETFVAQMNRRAKEFGCDDTAFSNCTGLPKEGQYSCARDVAVMFSRLLTHGWYFKYSKVWLEDFIHPDGRTTSMTNTNKLIKNYRGCDGGKTGFTNEAGFCLASTSQNGNMRLISVVLGSDSSANRFDAATKMFNFGFANYKNAVVLDKDINLSDKLAVKWGKKADVYVKPSRSAFVFSAVDKAPRVSRSVKLSELCAPICKGDVVGKVEIFKDNVLYDTVDLIAAEDVERAGYSDFLKGVAQNWAI